ncbi:Aste57867_9611 [Aphanomyces stellatus]|uniref:Aste57867_9611 protein n=1 Tax=Aphanomyces stellatus TaxID=120398 RepID=A0A485KNS8_9STRA|nr:hypothetical protein As57867_009573 [Aphanomyces stellatus]VFT86490.1 Aste57867_9611 [Aphanomyces stellatus]
MADKALRETINLKKRRAQELEKEAEEWTTPSTASSSVHKVRLGKRFQAELPPMRLSLSTDATKQLDVSGNTEDTAAIAVDDEVRANTPKRIYSAAASLELGDDLKSYLAFASTLCNGHVHGTPHAVEAEALHHLHAYGHHVLAAAAHLYASHAFPCPPPSTADDDETVERPRALKPKQLEWLAKFYALVGASHWTDEGVEALEALSRSVCPMGNDGPEMQVVRATLARIGAWQAACDETLGRRKCAPADLHALLHEATDMRCRGLTSARDMETRLAAFESAKTRLLAAVHHKSTSSSSKKGKMELATLQALLAHVVSFHIEFAQARRLEATVAEAAAVTAHIAELLAQDKVSVPAIRHVLGQVDALPVDLTSVVEPLKLKMVTAQKWLERARKCMPPTKRTSSRIAIHDHGKTKMDLEAVQELVQSAPVDDQSNEMQEMEDLLAYADTWSQKVQAALTDTAAVVSIDTLKEFLEEGLDMPVVMDLTTTLAAHIDAREWVDVADTAMHESCALDDLHDMLEQAQQIRMRLTASDAWHPPVEARIRASVAQAEAWLARVQDLLGVATWSKLFPTADRPKGSTSKPKAPLDALAAAVAEPSTANLSEYKTALEGLLTRGAEIDAACVAALDDDATAHGDAFQTAAALVDAIDAFPCVIERGEAVRARVTAAKDWLARARAVCTKQPTRRVTKKSASEQGTSGSAATDQVTLDELRALLASATTLAFRFPDDEALLAAEVESVGQWQADVQRALAEDLSAAMAACKTLEAIDAARVARRAAKWAKRKDMADRSPLTVASLAPTQEDVKAEAPATTMDTSPDDNEGTKVEAAAAGTLSLPQATISPAELGDALVQVIQRLSGCRTKASSADVETDDSGVDWSPVLAAVDASLAYIAALDAKAKDESDDDDDGNDDDAAAVERLDAFKTRLIALVAASNGNITTVEADLAAAVIKSLEWLAACRPLVDPKWIDAGEQLHARFVSDACPSWFAAVEWGAAMAWPLPHLRAQRDACSAWLAAIEAQPKVELETLERVLVDGESVGADDRFLWQELKKTKAWLMKAKKAIKAKATSSSKMAMHSLGNLVDDGAKCKIRVAAWETLRANYDAAVAWEAKLQASGLDSGQAKIAYLVDLLAEYRRARFVVDLTMHHDVLVSATEQYCICRQPYDGFMIGCEGCDDWFHDTCVGISKEKAEKVDDYVCPSCGLLQELKALVATAQAGTTALFQSEEKSHEKAFGMALRKMKKEERDVEKAQMTLLEVQGQVTAMGQHVQYLEKMQDDAPKQQQHHHQTLPSISIPLLHHHHHQTTTTTHHLHNPSIHPLHVTQPSAAAGSFPSSTSSYPPPPHPQAGSGGSMNLFKGFAPILRTVGSPFPSPSSSAPPPPFLQPMPPPPKTPTAPFLPSLGKESSTKASDASSSVVSAQDIEITRFKMEHYKLKQMVADAETSLAKGKDRLSHARAAIDALVTNRDVLLPRAQQWWQQVHVVLSQLLVEKERFDLHLLVRWAVECEDFQDKFPAVLAMQKVLRVIPWTIDAFALLHGHPKPSYDALDHVLKQSLHDPKVLLPLRGVLQRTDQWKARTQKAVQKLLTAKKIDLAKMHTFLNEYLKMPLTCSWGRKLEALVADLETRDPTLPPPTLDITPPSSPTPPSTLKRKPSKSTRESGGSKKAKTVAKGSSSAAPSPRDALVVEPDAA